MVRKNKKKHPVPLVGITGGIGSGKSLLAEMFKEFGAFVIDADKIGKEVLEKDKKVFTEVLKHFGENVLENDKKIDRKELAEIVFTNHEKLKKLNSIIHPPMIRLIEKRMKNEFKLNRSPMVVVDAALIFEAKVENKFDYIVNLYSNFENQIKRLSTRDGMSVEEIKKRMKSQISTEVKKSKSHYNIENNGTIEDLKKCGNDIFNKILEDFKKSD